MHTKLKPTAGHQEQGLKTSTNLDGISQRKRADNLLRGIRKYRNEGCRITYTDKTHICKKHATLTGCSVDSLHDLHIPIWRGKNNYHKYWW
jgi:hypothetical protein